ncbi:MAG: VCBS repeat-containing protein [Phycisphaerales bacterium]|nr:VCBS repeat-containing protein [Planctomycetota bacterium]MCH8509388.1 VCBS repeat-containing protein [Phycisphaerales bacterium]
MGGADASAQICFQNTILTTSENGARAVFAADMTGNGATDIITGRRNGSVTIWENDGAPIPTFTPRIINSASDFIRSLYVADLNGNGLPDILSASINDNTIAWYRNNGNNTYTRIVITNQAFGARSVFAADMNGNGHMDVLSASESDNSIRWYKNDGATNPTFDARLVTNQASGASSVYAADINGNGRMDILSSARLGFEVAWYENTGGDNPTFTRRVISTSQRRTESSVAVDMTGNGRMDIVVAATNDDRVSWFENLGGSPPNFAEHLVSDDIGFPVAVQAVDLDGDGHVDVLAAALVEDAIIWFQNNGDSPPTFTKHVILGDLDGASDVFSADVTGDGVPDVLSVSANDNTVAVHRQPRVFNQTTGNSYIRLSQAIMQAGSDDVLIADPIHFDDSCGLFINFLGKAIEVRSTGAIQRSALTSTVMADGAVLEAAPGYGVEFFGTLDVPPGAYASLIGDQVVVAGPVSVGVNGTLDGGPELVLAGLPSLTQRIITEQANGVWSVRAGDINGNGRLDLVSAERLDNRVAWYENLGGLNPTFQRRVIPIVAIDARAVHLADMNNNGHLDILVASFGDNTVAWYQNSGSNPPVFTKRTLTTQANGARSVFAADLTGNGYMDVISASENDNTVAWYRNSGGPNPTFTRHVITDQAIGASSVFAADINGNGLIDIVSAARLGFEIAWYENSGGSNPNFTRRVISTTQNRAEFVVAADIDNDGDIDILSASTTAREIVWFSNNGGSVPSFTEYVIDPDIGQPVSLAVADINENGYLDVVAAALIDNKVFWYENDGTRIPNFTKRVVDEFRDAARTVEIADLDGDGDLDIIAGSSRDDVIAWYQSGLITNIVMDRLGSTIRSPGPLLVSNKSIRMEQTTRLGSDAILSIEGSSDISGRGTFEAPLVSVGGRLRPDQGGSMFVEGNFLNSYLNPVLGREAGSLRIDLSAGPTPTSLQVSQIAALGGGLQVTAPPGLVPQVDQQFPPLLTAAALDPSSPRFDVVFSPVLDVEAPGGIVQGTLVARYSQLGEPGSVSMVAIPLDELLFTTSTFDSQGVPNDAVLADITGGPNGLPNGVLDLVIAVPFIEDIAPNGAIAVLVGSDDADGFGFESVTLYLGPNVDAPTSVEVGDFNQSGRPEIAYANRGDNNGNNNIYFLNVNSSATNKITPSNIDTIQIDPGFQVTDLAVGEILLIGFQRDDLIYGVRGGNTARLFVSTLTGANFVWETCEVDVDDIDSIVPFDRALPGLGQNGLAATNPSNRTVRVFNIVNGDVDNATFVDIPTGDRPRQVLAGRLDDDFFTDLVVLNEGDADGNPGSITLIRGLATGFAPPVNIEITSNPDIPPLPTSIALADLDNDGDLDIVIVAVNEQGERTVRQLRNVSADAGSIGLNFTAATDLPDQPGGKPLLVLSADLDGDNDGVPDDLIVLVDPTANGRGMGQTQNRITLSVPPDDCIADFNNDGSVDFFDLAAFLKAFNNQDPAADLAPPFGEWNFFDVAAYLALFNKGCP